MTALLDEVLTAHGGEELWRSVATITARGRAAGLLPRRFAGNKLSSFTFEVHLAEQRTTLHEFPGPGTRTVFDRGDVRVETRDGELVEARSDPRAEFSGLSGIRRNVYWDPLDVGYFAGYASWNYLTSPLLLAREGVETREGGTVSWRGEALRRLEVEFPADLHTHCRRQNFYIDTTGLIRRHDFVAEPVGRWASAALHSSEHRVIDGLVFPMRRRVLPRGPGGRSLPRPILLALDFDEITLGG